MFKRVGLFLLTNIAVLALLSVVMAVFGINPSSNAGLLVMAALFGFGGSFISLMLSKWMAKRGTGAHVIEQPSNESEQWLVSTVRRQAEAAGIKMPEVAIYDAPEINAFATGPSRNNSLVAVSTGLLRAMNRDEAEAVLAHEVSHVANGDMVTMALIQGVLNTFVIVLARLVGRVVDGYLNGGRDGPGFGYYIIVFVLDMIFGLFASMIAMWFSRHREFRADAGAHLDEPAVLALLDSLSRQSVVFSHWWTRHAVVEREGGLREFQHPRRGKLAYQQITFRLATHPDLKLVMLLSGAGV